MSAGISLCLPAGPVSQAHFTSLALCIDAVEATGQVGASDLQRLHETLYALQTLTYLQRTCRRVRSSIKVFNSP